MTTKVADKLHCASASETPKRCVETRLVSASLDHSSMGSLDMCLHPSSIRCSTCISVEAGSGSNDVGNIEELSSYSADFEVLVKDGQDKEEIQVFKKMDNVSGDLTEINFNSQVPACRLRKRKANHFFQESPDMESFNQSPPKRLKVEWSNKTMICSIKGFSDIGSRPYNEDRFNIQTFIYKNQTYIMAGVYDGHGGSEAAAYVSNHLFSKILLNIKCGFTAIPDAIKAAFVSIHQDMLEHEYPYWPKRKGYTRSTAGTTCSVVVITGGLVYYGNAGDSPIILGVQKENSGCWQSVRLSSDHSLNNSEEIAGVVSRGGQVLDKRVVWNKLVMKNGVPTMKPVLYLTMSRALGDFWSGENESEEFIISPIPNVGSFRLNPYARCIVLSTDGITDIMKDQNIIDVVQKVSSFEGQAKLILNNEGLFSNTPAQLIQEAKRGLQCYNFDNMTAVTIDLSWSSEGD